jgi:hypothetical protein
MGIRFNSLSELQRHSEMPSSIAMAGNLGKSLLEWSASGFKTCEGDELNKRLELCASCEYLINKRLRKPINYNIIKNKIKINRSKLI